MVVMWVREQKGGGMHIFNNRANSFLVFSFTHILLLGLLEIDTKIHIKSHSNTWKYFEISKIYQK